ncbi:TIM barrel protein [Sedimentitalea sp. JM2-8]|uniref:TIM barrel protein n=1 Tax=Sedimentitalea xiamensis TaxID=3050037 RepID=A0ABT7FG97_9RHOB|nr:TIM barrel protein [Sedimentitalea xiamensis]MDK3073829.1 TIM barrel protein [Sedimentitalea xiamensis]
MRPVSLAHLTFLDLPPPALIRLAAKAGFAAVGLRLIAVTETTPGYRLMDDPAMMRDTRRAMRDTGVTVNDIEFVRLTPEFDAGTLDAFLAAGAELEARHIVTAPYDPDLARLTDNLAAFADRAEGFGLRPVLEFFPWTNVPDLRTALGIVTATGNPSIGVLLDTLHFDRSGSRTGDLTQADPDRFPFIHLCDAMVQPAYSEDALLRTAREARMIPGQGEIPLRDILGHVPPEAMAALEIPMEAQRPGQTRLALAKQMIAAARDHLENQGLCRN